MTDAPVTRCGYVAIVGRPNVGKSTLLNHILGQKLAITSRKPQTTRHNMLGIKTEGEIQAVYVDTPGLHKNNEKALNRYMNRSASTALKDVDVVVFVVDRMRWTDEDQLVLEKVQYVKCPILLAVNKSDRLEDKSELLPHLNWLAEQLPQAEIVPISALLGQNLDTLEKLVGERLFYQIGEIRQAGLSQQTLPPEQGNRQQRRNGLEFSHRTTTPHVKLGHSQPAAGKVASSVRRTTGCNKGFSATRAARQRTISQLANRPLRPARITRGSERPRPSASNAAANRPRSGSR